MGEIIINVAKLLFAWEDEIQQSFMNDEAKQKKEENINDKEKKKEGNHYPNTL